MATLVQAADPATDRLVAELYRVEGKAEIMDRRILHLPMSGLAPGHFAFEIAVSLRNYIRKTKRGFLVPENVACLVGLPNRKSFALDAGYHLGPDPKMKFFQGAPALAVEVCSEHDYGRAAERDMAAKREDYFAAGTLTPAAVFRRGEVADAEPAVPGWTSPVEDLFPVA